MTVVVIVVGPGPGVELLMMLGATRCPERPRHAPQQPLENVLFGSPSGSIFEGLFGPSREAFLEDISGVYFVRFFFRHIFRHIFSSFFSCTLYTRNAVVPEKSVDSKKSVDSGFLKESKQEGSPIGQNVEKAQFQKKIQQKNTSKKKKKRGQEGGLQMHQNGNPFRRHPWSAFLTILHSALCPRRCVPWVAKPRRLAERWLAAALSRSLTATPPPEANHHIFF